MGKVLIVDDELEIAQLISDALEDEKIESVVISSGIEAIEYVDKHYSEIDLITLDIMMPEVNGYDVCRDIRSKISCPIIFISAKGKSSDAIIGLDIGADDYIAKPFVVEELVARIKAHLRRSKRENEMEEHVYRVGEIELYADSMVVTKNGKPVTLSTREFQLLLYLMENANKVLSREQIFKHVWNTEFGDIGTVAVNIKSVRDKIDPDDKYIKTVWGIGYKMVNGRLF